ncbi:MAG: penicillin acylase family protein, partial [Halobaculum sp.]
TDRREPRATAPALESDLAALEPPPWIGSNSWAVAGDHTESGSALVANDPHLTLMAPPVWYEQVLSPPEYRVRGVSFPGVPPVVIGENDRGAWGFTNAGADVIDFYEYETRADGAEYRYGEEWRAFETDEQTIAVAGGDDETVTVKKSVHGAVLDREADGDELRSTVGVAWTGLSATDTTLAVRALNRSTGIADVSEALRQFDEPTQNCVYADRDGEVLYRVTGKVPIRRTDGEPVSADRVFDGSAREGEWPGYTPYGESSWEGTIPYEEMPHVRNPAYVGTANQRIVDDDSYPHYFAEAYGAPFRGIRLWERLDDLVADGDVTPADLRDVQRDVGSTRVERFRPVLSAARETLPSRLRDAVDEILDWDGQVTRDSRAALLFVRFLDHYERAAVTPVLAESLGDRRDPGAYTPNHWVLAGLPPDSRWFPDGRDAAVETALRETLTEIDEEGWETYGDYQQTTVTHPFDRGGLNYPVYPTDGSGSTLFNVHESADAGSSWRQVCPVDERDSQCVLPGGNDGVPFADSYSDQLRMWADGEFKRMDRTHRGTVAVSFEGGDQ